MLLRKIVRGQLPPRQLPPRKIDPRSGLGFCLGLGLELGLGAVFVGDNCPGTNLRVFYYRREFSRLNLIIVLKKTYQNTELI